MKKQTFHSFHEENFKRIWWVNAALVKSALFNTTLHGIARMMRIKERQTLDRSTPVELHGKQRSNTTSKFTSWMAHHNSADSSQPFTGRQVRAGIKVQITYFPGHARFIILRKGMAEAWIQAIRVYWFQIPRIHLVTPPVVWPCRPPRSGIIFLYLELLINSEEPSLALVIESIWIYLEWHNDHLALKPWWNTTTYIIA